MFENSNTISCRNANDKEEDGGMKINLSLSSVLFLVFLVLKLTHVIDWSWWWVTAPLWGGFAIVIAVIAMLILIGYITNIMSE